MKTNDELAREAAEKISYATTSIPRMKWYAEQIASIYAPAIAERDRALAELKAIRRTPVGEAWHAAACLQAAVADNAAMLKALKENALIVRYPGVTHCVLCHESGETEVRHAPKCPLAKEQQGQATIDALAAKERAESINPRFIDSAMEERSNAWYKVYDHCKSLGMHTVGINKSGLEHVLDFIASNIEAATRAGQIIEAVMAERDEAEIERDEHAGTIHFLDIQLEDMMAQRDEEQRLKEQALTWHKIAMTDREKAEADLDQTREALALLEAQVRAAVEIRNRVLGADENQFAIDGVAGELAAALEAARADAEALKEALGRLMFYIVEVGGNPAFEAMLGCKFDGASKNASAVLASSHPGAALLARIDAFKTLLHRAADTLDESQSAGEHEALIGEIGEALR